MIRPISVSDTSFQGRNLKLHNKKKIARQVINLGKVEAKNAGSLKGIAKTPIRLGYVFNDNNTLDDASVGSGRASLAITAMGSVVMTSS